MQIRNVGLFVSTVAVLLESLSLKRWFMCRSRVKSWAFQAPMLDSYQVIKLWGHTRGHTRDADFNGVLTCTAIEAGSSKRREICDDKCFITNQKFQLS